MRKLALIPATALAIAVSSTGFASATQPLGGCSRGYELMELQVVLATIAAPGFESALVGADANADGQLCIKIIPNDGGPPQFNPAFLYVDNHVSGQA